MRLRPTKGGAIVAFVVRMAWFLRRQLCARLVVLAEASVTVGGGCGGQVGSAADGGERNAGRSGAAHCPPAPLIVEEITHDCSDLEFDPYDCVYAPPHMFAPESVAPEYCNDCGLACPGNVLQIGCEGRACIGFGGPVYCEGAPSDAMPCEQSDELQNGECLVPGPGADMEAGVIDGLVCACNEPGPVWRCVEVYELP